MSSRASVTAAISGLYAILDLPHTHGLAPAQALGAMIEGGASVIQLRSKSGPLDPGLARSLGARCAAAEIPLIINDELELAEAGYPGLTGVHLGQGDFRRLGADFDQRRRRRASLAEAGLWLGVSTHDLEQVQLVSEQLTPDYLGFGPVFSTSTKVNPDPVVGLDLLERACAASPVPVVAIGGIDLDRARQISTRGAAAIAVISALSGPSVESIRERTAALVRAFADPVAAS